MNYYRKPDGEVWAYDPDSEADAPYIAAILVEGATPLDGPPAPPEPPVPQTVSAFQARAVLHGVPSKANAGKTLLDDVNAIMSGPTVDPVAAIAWEYATVIERNGRFVQDIAPTLGLADAELDALFTAAAAIQA